MIGQPWQREKCPGPGAVLDISTIKIMKNFKVIASENYDNFCLAIRKALEEGWFLKGDEMFVGNKYVQCLINGNLL